ncbi:hypothetical protein C1752_08953 [Acaryochloris thomasi RCC1774]|uniref:Uncharacterized protein n=1 Tax=Acaryochloris thomasi RCC1774 TaxID=1764569 RepID=A0A2W1JNI4_9CYAN|nr:hypothetical protein [Acaryochloris thomasi]PZD70811.1 hypothetical protein C1752_08953 [Acaryochloris thomasi RCC1774]
MIACEGARGEVQGILSLNLSPRFYTLRRQNSKNHSNRNFSSGCDLIRPVEDYCNCRNSADSLCRSAEVSGVVIDTGYSGD